MLKRKIHVKLSSFSSCFCLVVAPADLPHLTLFLAFSSVTLSACPPPHHCIFSVVTCFYLFQLNFFWEHTFLFTFNWRTISLLPLTVGDSPHTLLKTVSTNLCLLLTKVKTIAKSWKIQKKMHQHNNVMSLVMMCMSKQL